MPKLAGNLPVVALTIGDPAGIGPEVVIKALADPQLAPLARWIVVGDARVLERAAAARGHRRCNRRRFEISERSPTLTTSRSGGWTPAAAPQPWSTSASPRKCAWEAWPTPW